MALFQWVTRLRENTPIGDLAVSVEPLGLALDPEFSNHLQLYLLPCKGCIPLCVELPGSGFGSYRLGPPWLVAVLKLRSSARARQR